MINLNRITKPWQNAPGTLGKVILMRNSKNTLINVPDTHVQQQTDLFENVLKMLLY